VRTHAELDARSLAIARAIAARIDADPGRRGLEKARRLCDRWCAMDVDPAREWREILARHDWGEVRALLLEESEEGARRRQNAPFCGVLDDRERWAILREFRDGEPKPA